MKVIQRDGQYLLFAFDVSHIWYWLFGP